MLRLTPCHHVGVWAVACCRAFRLNSKDLTVTWQPPLSSHCSCSFSTASPFLQSQPSLGSVVIQPVPFFPGSRWQWEDGRRREEDKHHTGASEEGGENWEGAVSSFSTEQQTSRKVRTHQNLMQIYSRWSVAVIWLTQPANRRWKERSEVDFTEKQ